MLAYILETMTIDSVLMKPISNNTTTAFSHVCIPLNIICLTLDVGLRDKTAASLSPPD